MAASPEQLITVYRSPRETDLYLYVSWEEDLARVPDQLLVQFGKPEPVMQLSLSAERKLARAHAKDVLNAILEKGYYLQLPPLKTPGLSP